MQLNNEESMQNNAKGIIKTKPVLTWKHFWINFQSIENNKNKQITQYIHSHRFLRHNKIVEEDIHHFTFQPSSYRHEEKPKHVFPNNLFLVI